MTPEAVTALQIKLGVVEYHLRQAARSLLVASEELRRVAEACRPA